MEKKISEGALVLGLIFAASYFLNFVWESLHSVFLYAGHDFNAKRYVIMVTIASGADGALILGIYLMVSLLWRDMLWLRRFNKQQAFASTILGFAIAAAIEYRHVIVMKTWNYSPFMPTLFGIGISPLFQLSITGLLGFCFTKRLMYSIGIYCER